MMIQATHTCTDAFCVIVAKTNFYKWTGLKQNIQNFDKNHLRQFEKLVSHFVDIKVGY